MRKARPELLLLLLLLLLLAACGRSPRAQLRAADALMESDPDSAMVLLRAVDRAGFSAADSAYYALLFTQAQIKTDVYLTSDSLIATALDAFRFSSDPDLRRRSHFYAAQVAHWHGDESQAMKNAIVAYDISKEKNDDYWIAKSAELISDILYKIYNYPESYKFEEEAIEFYEKAGKIINHRYAICDLGQHHLIFGEPERAYAMADSIRNIAAASNPPDEALEHYALRIVILALIDLKDYDKAKSLLPQLYQRNLADEAKLDIFLAENKVSNENDREEYVSKLFEAYSLSRGDKDEICIKYSDYKNAVLANDFKAAAYLADTLIQMQSNIAWDVLCESVSAVQRDYYIGKSEKERQESEFYLMLAVFIAILAIIVIAVVIIVYRYRIQAKRTELAITASSLLSVKKDYQEITRELFKEQWATLNMLCNQFFELNTDGIKKEILLKSIEKEIENLKTPKNIAKIEASVNRYHDNIIEKIRCECSFLKESDIVFLTLIIAGFSPRAICLFTDIKYKQYYQKRSRIRQRIQNSDAPHKGPILHSLS